MDGKTRTSTFGPINCHPRPPDRRDRRQRARIENEWVDLDYSLVNRATQASYDAYGLAEHYYGRDSDGPWTEGDRSGTIKIAAVPAGSYDLVVTYSGHEWASPSTLDTRPAGGCFEQRVARAATDDLLADALKFFGGPQDWFDIYKVLECLELKFGGTASLVANGWTSMSQLKLLRHSANVGNRHADKMLESSKAANAAYSC